jgi:hypothetical protein
MRIFQEELFKDAIAAIDGIPDARLKLNRWQCGSGYESFSSRPRIVTRTERITCDTIACAGGWLALHPLFRARGLRPEAFNGIPTIGRGDRKSEGSRALAILFGISGVEANTLFCYRTVEEHTDPKTKNLSDRQIWLRRAKEFLADRDQFNMKHYGRLRYQEQ